MYTEKYRKSFGECAEISRYLSSLTDKIHSIEYHIQEGQKLYNRFSKDTLTDKELYQYPIWMKLDASNAKRAVKELYEHLDLFDENFKDSRVKT